MKKFWPPKFNDSKLINNDPNAKKLSTIYEHIMIKKGLMKDPEKTQI